MSIQIIQKGITKVDADAIVNAANSRLQAGGGVCGAIFREAGYAPLQHACDQIGGCPAGSAVITPGFGLKAKYIIHAVGPQWHGGKEGEPKLLYGCYRRALELAVENGCRSIAFPLISSGIFGYPKDKAWQKALQACLDFEEEHPETPLRITFAILDEQILALGRSVLQQEQQKKA